jgi:uncharacterized protein YceK
MRQSVVLGALATLLAGCATIMHGTDQDIGFSSSPTNARIVVDNQPRGVTPAVVKLSRKDNHIVRMELDGYQPFEATLTHSVSGWVWGNIVFGGVIGLAVDAMTGGLYAIQQNQVAGTLAQANVMQQGAPKKPPTTAEARDDLFITIVPHADPSWKRIGTLVHAGK